MATTIPKLQRAAWIQNPGPSATVQIRTDIPVPQPGDGQVLVKIEYCGVCGSDIRNLHGMGIYTPVPGHEGVGTIVQLGPNVPSTYQLNERVGIKWLWSACGSCSLCRRGQANNCPRQLNTGKQVRGTLAEYALASAEYVTRLPEGLAGEVVAPLLCAGLSLMGAVGKVDVNDGRKMVVLGAGGGLGHLGVQIAREKGFEVIAVDAGEEKGRLSLECGAAHYIDVDGVEDAEVQAKVHAVTDGEGADAVIVVPGTESAFTLAPKLVRNAGIIVGVGLPRNDLRLPVGPTELSARGLTIVGAAVGTEAQMEELLDMAVKGNVVPKLELCRLEDTPDVFERLARQEIVGRCVVRIS